MKIQKAELATKLNKIKGVVPKKTNMEVLQGVLVKDGYLIANNMEITVKAKIDGLKEECFIIPEKAFELISNLPNGEIDISVTENSITIKANKIKNKYQTLDPMNFPISTEQYNGNELTIGSEALLKSISRVSYAVSELKNNTALTAMCLQAHNGKLNFVGTDGHVLAWDNVDFEIEEFSLLIPKHSLDKLKLLCASENVQIRCGKSGAAFIARDYEVYTRTLCEKYPTYETMLDRIPKQIHIMISRTELLDAMTRAKMCTVEKSAVKFELKEKQLNLSIKDSTTDYHEILDLKEELTETLIIGFDSRLVIETLKAFDCDNVCISFGGTKTPMVVEDVNNDFKAFVLPVLLL